jgi:hypothetical protein
MKEGPRSGMTLQISLIYIFCFFGNVNYLFHIYKKMSPFQDLIIIPKLYNLNLSQHTHCENAM